MNIKILASLGVLVLSACAALPSTFSNQVVYVVEASGGAWSASAKAREVMNSVDGIHEVRMSGARAVFEITGDSEAIEMALAAAFEERGMKLESFEEQPRPRYSGVVTVDTGVTWAVTAGKVREALIQQTGAVDVYFEDQIEIAVADPDEYSVDEAKRVLTESGVEFTTVVAAPR